VRIEVIIEVPRGSFVKRRSDGSVDYVSPVPCPYNYGHVAGFKGGDGDMLDAIVLGPKLMRGHAGRYRAREAVRFIDDGHIDDKVICSSQPLKPAEKAMLLRFFGFYAHAKGLLNASRGKKGRTACEGFVSLADAIPYEDDDLL